MCAPSIAPASPQPLVCLPPLPNTTTRMHTRSCTPTPRRRATRWRWWRCAPKRVPQSQSTWSTRTSAERHWHTSKHTPACARLAAAYSWRPTTRCGVLRALNKPPNMMNKVWLRPHAATHSAAFHGSRDPESPQAHGHATISPAIALQSALQQEPPAPLPCAPCCPSCPSALTHSSQGYY